MKGKDMKNIRIFISILVCTALVCPLSVLGGDLDLPDVPIGDTEYTYYQEDPTCTEDGLLITYRYGVEIKRKVLSALGHDYTEKIVKATYTEQGYTLHTCTRCGDSYADNYTDVLPLPQNLGDVDCDGEITSSDVTALSRFAAGWGEGYELADRAAADVDCDGEITSSDVTALSRFAAGWGEGYELGPKM